MSDNRELLEETAKSVLMLILSAVGNVVKNSLPASIAIAVIKSLVDSFSSQNQIEVNPNEINKAIQKLLAGIAKNDLAIDEELKKLGNG